LLWARSELASRSLRVFSVLSSVQELWIEYWETCETLKKEKVLYQTVVEPYATADAFAVLVQRVETLISKENTDWGQYSMKPEEKPKSSKL
jgi:hypothetical protein